MPKDRYPMTTMRTALPAAPRPMARRQSCAADRVARNHKLSPRLRARRAPSIATCLPIYSDLTCQRVCSTRFFHARTAAGRLLAPIGARIGGAA